MNVDQKCSSIVSLVSNLLNQISKVADDSSADATIGKNEIESTDNVTLSSEGFDWICTSRDNDGLSPFAIAFKNKNTFELQISKLVFSTIEECTATLSQPIEILDGEKFFCSSRDSDGLSPFAAFRWNVENNSLSNFDKKLVFSTIEECTATLSQPIEILDGEKFFCSSRDSDGLSPFAAFRWSVENNNLDKLMLINESAQKCMDSLMNVSVRDRITYVCASRDKDGLAPYSKFQISENPEPVGNKHNSLEDCIKTE